VVLSRNCGVCRAVGENTEWKCAPRRCFERPTVLEDGSKGLENWIRLFRQTFVEKMGEEAAAKWIHEVERQCRAETVPRRGLGAGLPETANYRL